MSIRIIDNVFLATPVAITALALSQIPSVQHFHMDVVYLGLLIVLALNGFLGAILSRRYVALLDVSALAWIAFYR